MNHYVKFLLLATLLYTPLYGSDNQDLLTVTGKGMVQVKASITHIRLAIETEGKNAQEVQTSLAENLAKTLDTLKNLKVKKLETGTMAIYPEYNDSKPPRILGYRGSVDATFEEDADKAGPALDAAITSGANRLRNITMRPDDKLLKEARLAALQLASKNAMEEARTVMATLQLESKGIKQVEILQEPSYGPVYSAKLMRGAAQTNTPSTEIMEKEQTIEASVTVKVEIESNE